MLPRRPLAGLPILRGRTRRGGPASHRGGSAELELHGPCLSSARCRCWRQRNNAHLASARLAGMRAQSLASSGGRSGRGGRPRVHRKAVWCAAFIDIATPGDALLAKPGALHAEAARLGEGISVDLSGSRVPGVRARAALCRSTRRASGGRRLRIVALGTRSARLPHFAAKLILLALVVASRLRGSVAPPSGSGGSASVASLSARQGPAAPRASTVDGQRVLRVKRRLQLPSCPTPGIKG